jgi:hypothetical protein
MRHSRFHNDGQYLVGSENKFTESEKEVFSSRPWRRVLTFTDFKNILHTSCLDLNQEFKPSGVSIITV